MSAEPFDPVQLLDRVPYLRDAELMRRGRNMLACVVDRGGLVRVSFAGDVAPRRLGEPERAQPPGIAVASLADLTATTVWAVQTGSRARDRLDLDALLRLGGIDLERALGAAAAVFGERFDAPRALGALTDFGDGDLHRVPESVRARLLRAADELGGASPRRGQVGPRR